MDPRLAQNIPRPAASAQNSSKSQEACCSRKNVINYLLVSGTILALGAVLLAIAAVAVAPLALRHKISSHVAIKMLAALGATVVTVPALIAIAAKLDKKS